MGYDYQPYLDQFVALQAPQLALYTLTLTAGYFVCWLLSEGTGAARRNLAHILFWFPFGPVLIWSAGTAVYELSGSQQERWFETTDQSYRFLNLYIGAQTLGTAIEVSDGFFKKFTILLHHVVSSLCIGGGLFFVRGHFWACLAGMCEVSTIFLNVLVLQKSDNSIAKWLVSNVPNFLVLNGVLLWASFIVFRLVLFPVWLIGFRKDYFELPDDKRSLISPYEVVAYPSGILLMLVLSALWFNRLHIGMVKAVKARMDGGDQKDCEKKD
eukprot:TRINITY_DN8739_c0_g3_i1.p1 TRINITY_DN8739_c0_g3~~TRINITY_DN8739_c0_g3_i1.p1  ORF type:complete len:269 (-),score=43.49 TRINITY_DN8739_c0_g3_i1:236-1042(-)